MTVAPRTPYALSLALLTALSLTACLEDDPVVIDEPPVVVVDDEEDDLTDELHLDGPNVSAPTLAAGVHRFGARFSESVLLDYDGRELTGIRVVLGVEPEYLDLLVYEGGDAQPLEFVAEILVDDPVASRDFVEYALAEPLVIDADRPLWLVAEVELAIAQQSIGCDAEGSGVTDGDWLWSGDAWRPFSERTGADVNWNIRGVIR